MLTRLNRVLLRRQSVGIVAHWIQHIETLLPLVSRIDVARDIAQWMPHVQSRSTRIRKHIQHVEFLLRLVLHDAISLVFHPSLLPFSLNFPEIIFHNRSNDSFSEISCKVTNKRAKCKRKGIKTIKKRILSYLDNLFWIKICRIQ